MVEEQVIEETDPDLGGGEDLIFLMIGRITGGKPRRRITRTGVRFTS